MNTEVAGHKPLKDRTSHSNFRKGLTDYHDGDNVTHYLGNDEYQEGSNIPSQSERERHNFTGEVAEGNQTFENPDEEVDYEEEIAPGGEDYDYE